MLQKLLDEIDGLENELKELQVGRVVLDTICSAFLGAC